MSFLHLKVHHDMQAQSPPPILIAQRLWVPGDTQAILWDMDGVLIDSLGLDLTICNQLVKHYFGEQVNLSNALIRSLFAYDPVKFWELILSFIATTYSIPEVMKPFDAILAAFNQARLEWDFSLNPGIIEILQAAHAQPLKLAVVSNNPTVDVEKILRRTGINDYFTQIIGNDLQQLQKKPAPDTYLFAAQLLEVNPKQCVVIEDSLVGAEAGYHAQCFTVGVATGSADFAALEQSPWTHQVYTAFNPMELSLQFGNVRQKQLITPNEFVSHMIEHIAWRLGVAINLQWYHNDWLLLGITLGQKIRTLPLQTTEAVALGMIDDGSAEVVIKITDEANLQFQAVENIDLAWFLSLRCEQLSNGQPLVELAQGLAQGLGAAVTITVCSVEDPHHTWEGVFRSLGIALHKIFAPPQPEALPFDYRIEENPALGEIRVLAKSLHYSKVFRGTAESHVEVAVDFARQNANVFLFNVAPSIAVEELAQLLELLAQEAGFTLQVKFNATVLSSSHVVLEDTALVLGRALLEILILRMQQWGINGAGSSIRTLPDLEQQPLRVGISVEGRKFWRLVPFTVPMEQVKKEFILGQTVYQQLRSEDLDDFLDGLSGGLACSIMIHIAELVEPQLGWLLLFQNLGKALKEVFAFNPYRQGVPPGVKATLS
jgi:HAD superfamily hydrolase (TIGR01509 family)